MITEKETINKLNINLMNISKNLESAGTFFAIIVILNIIIIGLIIGLILWSFI